MAVERRGLTAVERLAEVTGRDPEELRRHPRMLLVALSEFGRDVATTALELADEDPEVRTSAARRRAELLETLTRR